MWGFSIKDVFCKKYTPVGVEFQKGMGGFLKTKN